jgi:hypothetical protein
MNALAKLTCGAFVTGSLLLLAGCESPPTVVTQTTTTTETTAVTRGDRVIAPPTPVVYPSATRTVAYYDRDDDD